MTGWNFWSTTINECIIDFAGSGFEFFIAVSAFVTGALLTLALNISRAAKRKTPQERLSWTAVLRFQKIILFSLVALVSGVVVALAVFGVHSSWTSWSYLIGVAVGIFVGEGAFIAGNSGYVRIRPTQFDLFNDSSLFSKDQQAHEENSSY